MTGSTPTPYQRKPVFTRLYDNTCHRPRHLLRRRGAPRVAPANIVGFNAPACSGLVRWLLARVSLQRN